MTVTTQANNSTSSSSDEIYIQMNSPKPNPLEEFTRASSIGGRGGGLTLQWHDLQLNVTVKDPKQKNKTTKPILKHLHGQAHPGELLVIMGPSGAGKTSLLNCLAGRNSNCTGAITVNGVSWSKSMRSLSSYVMQDDVFYETLTVKQHLMYQAQLRIGQKLTKQQRQVRVEQVLEELGLAKCADTQIGGIRTRGISGGERKRLSFATELLTNPSLLFVDEPTSGLDSFMAETVMKQLLQLAKKGRTVIATIHQPSSEIYALFDKLLLLADGHIVYHGKSDTAVNYFDSVGYKCPSYSNPSDYFMRQLALNSTKDDGSNSLETLVNEWRDKSSYKFDEANKASKEELVLSGPTHLGLWRQLNVLMHRNATRIISDRTSLAARFGISIFLSVVVGLIFLQLDLNQSGVQNFTGVLFFMTVNQMFATVNPELAAIPNELPIFYREYNAGLFYSFGWFLAKNISELPLQLIFPSIFVIPLYFMVGFNLDAAGFFTLLFVYILVASCSAGMAYMISCLASRPQITLILAPMVMLPFLLFGGLFLNNDSAPEYLVWVQYVSPVKYGFEAAMATFWRSVDHIPCTSTDVCRFKKGEEVLAYQSFDSVNVAGNCAILVIINVCFRTIAFLCLWRRTRKQ